MPKRTLIVSGVVIAGVSGLAGYLLVGYFFDRFRVAELKDWHTRTVAGITLDSPGDFKEKPIDFGEVQKLIDKNESLDFSARGFEIEVLRIDYKPDVQLNMDGAVNGSVAAVAALEGVTNLKHTANATTVSGKQADRVSMTGDRTLDGRSGVIHVEGVYIIDGRTFYQVEAVYDSSNPHGAEYADRVLKSVKFAP